MKNAISLLLLILLPITLIQNIQSAAMQEIEQKELKKKFVRAAELDEVDLLNDCLSKGVNVNAVSRSGKTALLIAIGRQNQRVAKALLELDDPKNLLNVNAAYNGWTALSVAAATNNEEIVRMLLEYKRDEPEHKVNVNATNKEGHTALMLAAIYGHAEIIKIFAKHNIRNTRNMIDGNIVDKKGLTALMLAIKFKKVAAVQALLFPFKQSIQERETTEDQQDSAKAEADDSYFRDVPEQEKGYLKFVDINCATRKRVKFYFKILTISV